MKSYKIKNTELDASEIIYGCMNIGCNWDKSPFTIETVRKTKEIVRTAIDEGINYFDHADIYTYGKSEQVFAQILKEDTSLRDKIIIQSKCGIRLKDDPVQGLPQRYDFSYSHIIKSVDGILDRLNTEFIDVLLLHRPDPLIEPEEVAGAFEELESKGKVKYFGVSNHTASQISLLQKYLGQKIIINQVELNLFKTDLIDSGIVGSKKNPGSISGEGTLEYCRKNEISIQAWSPVAKGILSAGEIKDSPKYSGIRNVLNKFVADKNSTIESILIAWLLKHPAKIHPVIGTTNIQRIKDCCAGASVSLSREEWYELYIAARGEYLP